jgi:5-methylthioadenosine/S-adenosylhomocysteine deaminase
VPNAATLTSQHPLATIIDVSSRIIAPGFVNAHVHGASVLLRSLTRGYPLSAWNTLVPLRQATEFLLDPSSVSFFEPLALFAGTDHLLHGTTTVADVLPPADVQALGSAVRGHARAGIRSTYTLSGWSQIRGARNQLPPPGSGAVAFDMDEELTIYGIEKHLRAAKELGLPPAFQLGETRKGVDALKRNFKKSPVRVIKEAGALLPQSWVAHGNYFVPADLDLLAESGVTLTICCGSASRKRTGCPVLLHLASRDLRLAVGTDWGSVDMLGELKFLSMLPSLVSGVRQFRALELIRMATINGAHALGIASDTGSLEVGKRADLVMFTLENMFFPLASETAGADVLAETIIERMDAGRVSDVMVDGVFRVRDHVPIDADLKTIEGGIRSLVQRAVPQGIPAIQGSSTARAYGTIVPAADQAFLHEKSPAEHRQSASQSGFSANLTIITSTAGIDEKPKQPEVTKGARRVFGEDDT